MVRQGLKASMAAGHAGVPSILADACSRVLLQSRLGLLLLALLGPAFFLHGSLT